MSVTGQVQKASDFFKSATRNITVVLWTIRLVALFFLYLLVSRVLNALDEDVKQTENLEVLGTVLILLFFGLEMLYRA